MNIYHRPVEGHVQMIFSLTKHISAYKIKRLITLFDLSLHFHCQTLNRKKTEHNVINVVCTEHFDSLMKLTDMEIT